MNTQSVAVSTKDVLESTRGTLINVIRAGHGGTRGALRACDQLTKTGVDLLAGVPARVATSVRDDVVSIEGQVTLIASALTESMAAGAEEAANRAAHAASGAVDGFERIFDTRVMDAIARAGAPTAEVIRDLAERIAALARDVARLSDLLQPLSSTPTRIAAKPAASSGKRRASTRKAAPAVKRARTKA